MRTKLLLIILLSLTAKGFSQINMADTSVQCIAFWDKGEAHTYSVTTEKIKIQNGDTVSQEYNTIDYRITVLDSTESHYILQWESTVGFFETSEMTETQEKLLKITENMEEPKLIYQTDEMGAFQELLNYDEIVDYKTTVLKKLEEEYKDDTVMSTVMKAVFDVFLSEEAFTNQFLKTIHQFHYFFGVEYKQGDDIISETKIPNGFGGEDFDADVVLYLDTIDEENNTYTLVYVQDVNPQQLKDAVFAFLNEIAAKMSVDMPLDPDSEDFANLQNRTIILSYMHNSGWPLGSTMQSYTDVHTVQNIEIVTIEYKF